MNCIISQNGLDKQVKKGEKEFPYPTLKIMLIYFQMKLL